MKLEQTEVQRNFERSQIPVAIRAFSNAESLYNSQEKIAKAEKSASLTEAVLIYTDGILRRLPEQGEYLLPLGDTEIPKVDKSALGTRFAWDRLRHRSRAPYHDSFFDIRRQGVYEVARPSQFVDNKHAVFHPLLPNFEGVGQVLQYIQTKQVDTTPLGFAEVGGDMESVWLYKDPFIQVRYTRIDPEGHRLTLRQVESMQYNLDALRANYRVVFDQSDVELKGAMVHAIEQVRTDTTPTPAERRSLEAYARGITQALKKVGIGRFLSLTQETKFRIRGKDIRYLPDSGKLYYSVRDTDGNETKVDVPDDVYMQYARDVVLRFTKSKAGELFPDGIPGGDDFGSF